MRCSGSVAAGWCGCGGWSSAFCLFYFNFFYFIFLFLEYLIYFIVFFVFFAAAAAAAGHDLLGGLAAVADVSLSRVSVQLLFSLILAHPHT